MSTEILLMVGTAKGAFFFRSDEGRSTWSVEGPCFRGWEVSHLLYDPRGVPCIYATLNHAALGVAIHRTHRLTDLGREDAWEKLGTPGFATKSSPSGETKELLSEEEAPTLNRLWCLAPGANSQPEVLYAGVDEAGLFRTRDRGTTWEPVSGLNDHPTRKAWLAGHGGLACHWIRVHPEDDQRLWAAVSIGGVFRSEDGGETWQVMNHGLPLGVASPDFEDVATCVHRIAVSTENPQLMYQQNHHGLFRSRDGAETWERIETGLRHHFGLPLAIDPSDDRRLFACPIMEDQLIHVPIDDRLEIWLSEDGGEHWHPQRSGLPAERYYHFPLRYGLAADGLQPCGAYVGTTAGDLFFSKDDGHRWAPMPGFDRLPRILSVEAVVLSD